MNVERSKFCLIQVKAEVVRQQSIMFRPINDKSLSVPIAHQFCEIRKEKN